jgi:hypothetical protein
MAESDFPRPYIIGYGSSPSRCVPELFVAPGQTWDLPVPEQRASTHAGSSTTPGRVDARFHAPTRVAFRIRNGVGTRDKNLCEAQWLACVLLYRRFAAALTGDCARLEADVVSYSFIVS